MSAKVYKLGKKEPRIDKRTVRLASFVDMQVLLPATPDSMTLSTVSGKSIPTPMYDNDKIGCCDIASGAHMVIAQSFNDRDAADKIPTQSQVVKGYSASGGYDPSKTRPDGSNPTDGGCIMLNTMGIWKKTGMYGIKILGYGAVDINPDHAIAAMYLFGGIKIGLSLPVAVQDPSVEWVMPQRFMRGPAWRKGSWGGHAVYLCNYDKPSMMFEVVTWGGLKKMSMEFFMIYCDEAYFTVSPSWTGADGKAPNGVGAFELLEKLKSF